MKTAKLGELVKITIGRTPSRGNEDFWDKDKNTSNVWLSIADLLNADGRIVTDSKEYVTDEAANSFAIVPQGTLLVSFKLTLGRLAYAGRDLRTNEAIAALHNDQAKVTNDYLYHYLSRFDWNEYAKADQKVKGLTLNKAKLAEIAITYPESFEEQRRIVERLDAAFERISAAEVLMRRNLDNVAALQKSILHKYLSASDSTHTHRLGDLCAVLGGKRLPRGEKLLNTPTSHPYIRVADFDGRGGVNMSDIKYIPDNVYEKISRYIISTKDVFLSIAGTIGVTGIIPEELEGANLTENACRLVPSDAINTRYLYYFSTSDIFRSQALAGTKQTAQPKLALIRIKDIKIDLPDIKDQEIIVDKLDNALSKTRKLESQCTKKLAKLTELRQSLLVEAFMTTSRV